MTPTTSTTPLLDLDPRSGELAAEGVMRWSSNITMRDGVQLATDIYAGEGAGQPLPVLLERTPYGRRHGRRSDQDRHDQPIPAS